MTIVSPAGFLCHLSGPPLALPLQVSEPQVSILEEFPTVLYMEYEITNVSKNELTLKFAWQPPLAYIASMGVSIAVKAFTHDKTRIQVSLLGSIAILGVAANETIVVLDFLTEKRQTGIDRMTSIIETAHLRIRAIFLTAATTAAGVMPATYGLAGDERFLEPITIAKAWGVLGGSLLIGYFFLYLLLLVTMPDKSSDVFSLESSVRINKNLPSFVDERINAYLLAATGIVSYHDQAPDI